MSDLPASEAELDAFLSEFESGALAKERWTHAAHVLTGACYVHSLGEAAATEQMRHAVRRYNIAVGGRNTATSGYHETVTIFWIKLLAALLRDLPAMARARFAVAAVERYGATRGTLAEFYDFDVVGSERARREWVPPTRKGLGGVPGK